MKDKQELKKEYERWTEQDNAPTPFTRLFKMYAFIYRILMIVALFAREYTNFELFSGPTLVFLTFMCFSGWGDIIYGKLWEIKRKNIIEDYEEKMKNFYFDLPDDFDTDIFK